MAGKRVGTKMSTRQDLVAQISALLEGLTPEEVSAILQQVSSQVSYGAPVLTAEDIEKRNYTFVQILSARDSSGEKVNDSDFIVPSRLKEPALKYARQYASELGWTCPEKTSSGTVNWQLYPGNYVVKARKLFAEGMYPGGTKALPKPKTKRGPKPDLSEEEEVEVPATKVVKAKAKAKPRVASKAGAKSKAASVEEAVKAKPKAKPRVSK